MLHALNGSFCPLVFWGATISQKTSNCLVYLISNKTNKFSKIQRWGGLFVDQAPFIASSRHLFWKQLSPLCAAKPHGFMLEDTDKAVCSL